MLSVNSGKMVFQYEDYKVGKNVNYIRFNYLTNKHEDRVGKIRGLKLHEKMLEVFVRDVEDDTRNCIFVNI